MTHTRFFLYLAALLVIACTQAQAAGTPDAEEIIATTPLIHMWEKSDECAADDCTLLSSYTPAIPAFGMTEATLSVAISPRTAETPETIQTILKHEMRDIRAVIPLAEYREEDGRTIKDNMASWTQTINGKQIGFIKYSALPSADGGLPFTVIHGIVPGDEYVSYVHLVTFFAAHQEEIRNDQMTLLKKLTTL